MLKKTLMLPAFMAASAIGLFCYADGPDAGDTVEFDTPVRLKANGTPIHLEAPGYASPCWYDIDQDGHKDLLVGQFAGGKINVFRNLGNGELAEGQWLEAEGAVAEVPGVW